jgi:eukaryotic-like serine/threonine-protein kinase
MDTLVELQALFAGKYRLEGEVGRGGMATVYLAVDEQLQRNVAIKVLHPDLAAAVGAERFRREIEIARKLTHPGILSLYDSGETAGKLYYVMPYVAGESLRARLDREGQLPVDEAVRLIIEVADALHFAHKNDVLHRDIKPENILLDDGHALLADFGIARVVGASAEAAALTQTGMAIGTPTYMSPEQGLADKAVDARSDQYALACVLYETLAGVPPFSGGSMQTLIMRHAMEQAPSLRIMRQTVSEELEAVIMRALEKSPADRWATLRDFAEALRSPTGVTGTWYTSRTSSSMPVVRLEPPPRKKWVIPSAIAATLVLVLGAGYLGWRYQSGAGGAAPAVSPRVAVLYFTDASPGKTLGYLGDALTEGLIERLSQIPELDVVSRNGVEPFRETETSTDSIARVLQAGTVVAGTVEQAGDQFTVRVRLLDESGVSDQRPSVFTASMSGALDIQQQLVEEVATHLQRRLGRQLRLQEQRAATRNANAWLFLQRGEKARKDAEDVIIAHDADGGEVLFARADSLFVQAQALDARWPEPFVQRSWIAYRRARLAHSPQESVRWAERSIALADSALQLDPRSSAALEYRGTSRYFMYLANLITDPQATRLAFEQAEKDLVAATEANRRNASAWTTLSHLYAQKPSFPDAVLAAQQAYEADAFLARAADIVNRLYRGNYVLQNFRGAENWCTEGRRRFPGDHRFQMCRVWLMTLPSVTPRPEVSAAWTVADSATALAPESNREYAAREARVAVAIILGRLQLQDSASRVLDRVRATPEIDPHDDLMYHEAYGRLTIGQRDRAIRLLKEYVVRNPQHREGWLKDSAWWWRDLESDPEFRRTMGFEGAN